MIKDSIAEGRKLIFLEVHEQMKRKMKYSYTAKPSFFQIKTEDMKLKALKARFGNRPVSSNRWKILDRKFQTLGNIYHDPSSMLLKMDARFALSYFCRLVMNLMLINTLSCALLFPAIALDMTSLVNFEAGEKSALTTPAMPSTDLVTTACICAASSLLSG